MSAVWKVACRAGDTPCAEGTLEGGWAAFAAEADARAEFAAHAGHGFRSLHYCADADPDPAHRWNDRDDPRACYEEAS